MNWLDTINTIAPVVASALGGSLSPSMSSLYRSGGVHELA